MTLLCGFILFSNVNWRGGLEAFCLLTILLLAQAIQALSKVLELSDGKRTDLITLTKIVEEVERIKSPSNSETPEQYDASNLQIAELDLKQNEAQSPTPDEQIRATREALTLFEMTGKLLNQVTVTSFFRHLT